MITVLMQSLPKKRGFTLIEILVVIAIIGILSTVIYASFDGARQQARNKALMAEMKEVQLALEVYKAQHRRYPSAAGVYPANLRSALTPTFISRVPDATGGSRNTNCALSYSSDANGSYYKLAAVRCFEGATAASQGIQPDTDFARCPSTCGTCAGQTNNASYQQSAPFYESLAVYSAGGECL